jgi:hypothetical protein
MSTDNWAPWGNRTVDGGGEHGPGPPEISDEQATATTTNATASFRTHPWCHRTDDAWRVAAAYDEAMRGDRVEIVVDIGTGVQTFEVVATRAGRRVDVSTGRGVIEVSEITRGGTIVRTARFLNTRVVAVVEHPAEDRRPG